MLHNYEEELQYSHIQHESITATVKIMNPTDMMTEMQGRGCVFNNLTQNNSYRIQPKRDNDVMNGVTTFDIALLSKHILNLQPIRYILSKGKSKIT